MLKNFILRSLACSLLAGGLAAGSHAADVVVSGHLTYNTDVVRIDFTLASTSDVTLWTDSWLAGLNFDPSLTLFDAGFARIVPGDDTSDPAALLPGQGGYDSQIRLASLAPGVYHLTLTASGNDPLGPTLADGFSLVGTTPIPIVEWNQPSYDINANDQKGTFWRVHLDNVGAVTAVPEPSEIALMLAGLVAIGGVTRRRARQRSPLKIEVRLGVVPTPFLTRTRTA
jgi:hypothetical protein